MYCSKIIDHFIVGAKVKESGSDYWHPLVPSLPWGLWLWLCSLTTMAFKLSMLPCCHSAGSVSYTVVGSGIMPLSNWVLGERSLEVKGERLVWQQTLARTMELAGKEIWAAGGDWGRGNRGKILCITWGVCVCCLHVSFFISSTIVSALTCKSYPTWDV